MPVLTGPRGVALLGGMPSDYINKLRYIARGSLIGLWPLGEQSGSVAYDLSGRGHNGSYTGVSFVQPGVELLANGGMETAGAGGDDVLGSWIENKGTGTIVRTTTAGEFAAGAAAGKLTNGGTGDTYMFQTPAAIPWTRYQFGYGTRGDGTNAGRYRIWDNTANAAIADWTSTGITGTSYSAQSIAFSAPGGCLSTIPILGCPETNAGWAAFDSVSLVASAPNGPVGGYTAPYFDGTNDFVNLHSAALASAFNGSEGTLLVWARVSGAGVWTDGASRYIATCWADADNRVVIQKSNGNNAITMWYIAGGTMLNAGLGSLTQTTWMPLAITWSKTANQMKCYANGSQFDTTKTGLGTWVGTLGATTTLIGASSTVPSEMLSGLAGFCVLATRAFTPAEVWHASQAA